MIRLLPFLALALSITACAGRPVTDAATTVPTEPARTPSADYVYRCEATALSAAQSLDQISEASSNSRPEVYGKTYYLPGGNPVEEYRIQSGIGRRAYQVENVRKENRCSIRAVLDR